MPSTPSTPSLPADTRRAVPLLALAAFASSVAMRLCDPMLPALAAEFGVDLAQASAVITGFALAYGLLQLPIGPLADRWGKFRVVRIACGVAGLAALACALAPGLQGLVLARVVAGGVGGAIIPVALAWLGDAVPLAERQPVLARVMSGALLGLIVGQLLSGLLADTLGWRWAFVALALLFIAVAWWMRGGEGGAGAQSAAQSGADAGAATGAAAARGANGGLFGWWRAYLGLLRPPWSRLVLAVALVEGVLMYGAVAFVPSALHLRFGVPLWQAAGVSALVGAGGFAYTVLARRLVQGLGERRLAALGGTLVGAGLLAIALAPWLPLAVAGGVALGLGFYAFHNTLQVHGTQLSVQQRGMGMALFALSLFLGQSLGVALAAQVVDRFGFAPAFVGAAIGFVAMALGFTAALARRARAGRPG